jgi:APA family basic amino acid/polyamine antiporter
MTDSSSELKRGIGLFSCIMLVSGNMIGVGIFTTPGVVAKAFGQPWEVLLAWGLGGFLALTGALSFGELGAMYPEAGGTYVFLREAFGRPWAFISGWIFAAVITPGVVAVLAIGFASYLGFPAGGPCKAAAVGAILLLAAVNYRGVRTGAFFQDVATFGKIAAMLGFSALAYFCGRHLQVIPAPALVSPFRGPSSGAVPLKSMAVALIPIMYTYSGWNAAVLVGGEIKDPGRTIPQGLLWGTLVVTVVYLAMNTLYLAAVPVSEMRGDIVIAQTAAHHLLGPAWARAVAFLIAASSLGCLNATILTGPRIPYAMARDGLFFKAFEWVHPRFSSPGKAILFQMAWAVVLALTGTFDQLLDWVTVPSLLISLFCVAGLIRLRFSRPQAPRPYRVWAYPWVPLVFILMVVWVLVDNFRENPRDSFMGMGMIILGIPLYLFWTHRGRGIRSS